MHEKDRIPLILAGFMLAGLFAHIRAVTGIEAPTPYLVALTGGVILALFFSERNEAIRLTALTASLILLLMMLVSPVSLHPLMPAHQTMKAVQTLEQALLGFRGFSDLFNSLFYYALDYEKYPSLLPSSRMPKVPNPTTRLSRGLSTVTTIWAARLLVCSCWLSCSKIGRAHV